LLIDARNLPENKLIETGVCIVGAGAAGITLAREFVEQSFQVCLLESGGLKLDAQTQSLSQGENIGLPYSPLHRTRLRKFGGTTEDWAGWCAPFGDLDFETRDWVCHSGWPLDKFELDPFYERAHSMCQLGSNTYDTENWETEDTPRLPFINDRIITRIFQISPVTRFGKLYRDEITQAKNISTFIHATVLEIETTDTARAVTRSRVATLRGNTFFVVAKVFILAAGGIENARLLLVSNKVQKNGLGNQYDLVGRYFMEHPYFYSGVFFPSGTCVPLSLYSAHKVKKPGLLGRGLGSLSMADHVLRRERMVNCVMFFAPRYKTYKEFTSPGVASVIQILKEIRHGSLPHDLLHNLRSVIKNINDVALTAYRKFLESNALLVDGFALRTFIEAAPNRESRVSLSDEFDRLGMNRVRLEWKLSEIDERSTRRAHEILNEEIQHARLGQLNITLDSTGVAKANSLTGGSHHMGTTRMHVDPKKGVVDANCQVHGIANMFVAGSSVFPTSGSANPTLTIVALAIRLADYMKRLMK